MPKRVSQKHETRYRMILAVPLLLCLIRIRWFVHRRQPGMQRTDKPDDWGFWAMRRMQFVKHPREVQRADRRHPTAPAGCRFRRYRHRR